MRIYVGSRDLRLPGYLSVDIDPANHPDIVADVRDLSVVQTGSCEEVKASHVLEHLEWPDSFKALSEFARVLKRGGLLRVAVPDVTLLVGMLASGESDFHAAGLLFGVGGRTNTFEAHRYGFTERMLRRLLSILGFGDFGWWNSDLPECANGWAPANAGEKTAISLNIEARKKTGPIVDPLQLYQHLKANPLDDPSAIMVRHLGAFERKDLEIADVAIYQMIHFQLIDAIQRIKFLEGELRKAEARCP